GGDALYELSGYPAGAGAGFSRLHFTTFAYPDEWGFTSQKNNPPTFFANYAQDFDPLHQHKASPYGYTRPTNDAILSYDALNTLLTGCGRVLSTNKTHVVREDLRQALAGITGAQAIQGVSGRIAFDQNGDPIDKALVILVVSPQGYIQLESLQGHFLLP
ncbi:MAG TPA: hypothetical protein VFN23_08955, partial [Ktedonobacteraceae bacterium]|nr:hypothetical protein [Ktedonobacteraceae bacterium]